MHSINVTKTLGAGALGYMPPQVGMATDKGLILSLPSNINGSGAVCIVGTGTGETEQNPWYTSKLYITVEEATNNWGWPTAAGAVSFGHSGQPVHKYAPTVGSGQIYVLVGGTPVVTYR